EKRLTTVVAGAGYGKTTFAVQAGHRLGLPTAWVGLDEKDRDIQGFFRYVTSSVESRLPGFDQGVIQVLDRPLHPGEGPDRFVLPLLSALEDRVTVPLILVLDDFHAVQDDEMIQEAMNLLLRHLPSTVHLVLTGRTEPRLPLSRLRALRALQEVRENDLAFTPAETEDLFKDLFHVDLTQEQRDRLQEMTGGWVSGLILFRHSTKDKPPGRMDHFLADLVGLRGGIAAYLEENVLHSLPEDTRSFLLRTCILSRLEGPFCDRFLDRTDSACILQDLERDHLFTFSTDEDRRRFQVHRLFRDFLRRRLLLEFREDEVRALHKRAAVLLEAEGHDEEALEHHLSAGRIRDACRILGRIAIRLVLEGRYPLIRSYLAKIPEATLQNEPWFQFIRAGGLELAGKFRKAAALYEKALKAYPRHASPAYRAICLQSLGRTLFLLGDLESAKARFQELMEQGTVTSFHPLGTLGYLVFIASLHGRLDDADRYYRQGKAMVAEGAGRAPEFEAWLEFGLSARYLASGDLDQALDTADQANETISSYRQSRGSTIYPILAATICHRMGRFAEGLAHAENGLRVVKEKPYQDSARGRLLLLCALNRLETGSRGKALFQAKQGQACFEQNQNVRGRIFAHTVLHTLYRHAGDDDRAEAQLNEGFRLASGAREPILEAELRRHLAALFIERGETEKALPFLEASARALAHSAWDRFQIALLYTRLHQHGKREKDAMNSLVEALALSENKQFEPWIALQKDWILPLLTAAYARGFKGALIRRCLPAMGPTARHELERLRKRGDPNMRKTADRLLQELPSPSRPGLKVCMLGTFRVWIGEEEIPRKRWRGNQPLDLFKYLLNAYPRAVKNHALMELLWPGRDPARGRKRLNVALVSLRKALEPDRARGTPSAYLLKSGDAYRIDPGKSGWVDVERFREAVRKAETHNGPEEALAHYRQAEALYGGDFLAEDPYAEWCVAPRERLRQAYLRVVSRLLDAFEERGDLNLCIAYAEKGLHADPYDEVLYQRLMRYHQRAGNRAMVVQTFERCRKRIEETLHCTLAEETQALFEELVGQAPPSAPSAVR
ncbi:MAG: BTAD domain-containing putative transcriptional regulator, partial [Desulfobacteraceae bacterium]